MSSVAAAFLYWPVQPRFHASSASCSNLDGPDRNSAAHMSGRTSPSRHPTSPMMRGRYWMNLPGSPPGVDAVRHPHVEPLIRPSPVANPKSALADAVKPDRYV